MKNPFTYGNPITDPTRFVGRRKEVDQVHSRLLNAEFESSSVVGERRIGKTSLLLYLSHPRVTQEAGFAEERYIFVYVDLQILDPGKTPTDFWRRVLGAIRRRVADDGLTAWIDEIRREPSIDAFILDDVFGVVDDLDLYIVLLLDEFERVTQNASFDVDFFSGLRSMAIHHNLALITSSRRELVALTHSKEVQDSPFFNIFANINLRPFSEGESLDLIEIYLAESGVRFHQGDIDYARWLAGPHPYFVQMACSLLYEAYQDHPNEAETQARRRDLNREFREEAAPVYSDYWHHTPQDQRELLAACARHHREQGASGCTLEELEALHGGVERVLMALEKRGLILVQEGPEARYGLFSPAFGAWVAAESERAPDMSEVKGGAGAGTGSEHARLVQLRQTLTDRLSIGDLRTLCFDMDVDYGMLGGENKGDKVRELVLYAERRGLVPRLIEAIRQLRPDIEEEL
jgi:hypothetical protein